MSDEQLFSALNRTVADTFGECFTNIPQVVTSNCNQNAMKNMRDNVMSASCFLINTNKILDILV